MQQSKHHTQLHVTRSRWYHDSQKSQLLGVTSSHMCMYTQQSKSVTTFCKQAVQTTVTRHGGAWLNRCIFGSQWKSSRVSSESRRGTDKLFWSHSPTRVKDRWPRDLCKFLSWNLACSDSAQSKSLAPGRSDKLAAIHRALQRQVKCKGKPVWTT